MAGPNDAIVIEIRSKKSNIDKNEIKHRNRIKEILEMSEATIIMDCIFSTFVSILFNGGKLQPFNQSHEIRRRDSLSPYIFFLCLEYLGLIIYGKSAEKTWKPIKAANNLIFFGRATLENSFAIDDVLSIFYNHLG